MKDGVVLMYCKDGILYPVSLTQEQYGTLQFLVKVFEPLKVISSHPQGKSVNLIKGKDAE